MRILLRHAPTGQYFQCLEKWTSSPKKAHDFRLIARALRFAGKTGFSDMELVLFLGHPDQSHLSICEAALLSQSMQRSYGISRRSCRISEADSGTDSSSRILAFPA